jgi:hypothetical protein
MLSLFVSQICGLQSRLRIAYSFKMFVLTLFAKHPAALSNF